MNTLVDNKAVADGMAVGKVLTLVRRIAVELTFLAPGQDDDFNQILENLRRSLSRSESGEALQSNANEFFQYLMRSNAAKKTDGPSSDITDAVRELFVALDLEFPQTDNSTDDSTDVKSQAGTPLSSNGIVTAIRQLAPVATQMRLVAVQSQSDQQTKDKTENEDKKLAVSPKKNAGKKSSWLSKMAGRADECSSEDVADVIESLGPVLENVIDHIQALDARPDRSLAVKATLQAAESMADLESVLEATLQLVVDIAADIDRERGRTETFLSEIRLQLNVLENGIVGIIDIDTSVDNADRIQQDVSNEVSGIELAVTDSNNLEELKTVVATRIEALTERLSGYIDNERAQLHSAKQKVGELSEKMHTMSTEIEGLQHLVSEKQLASVTDALTGVANRGGFDKKLAEEFVQSRRINYPLTLMFIDVDKFKDINDNFGHNAGDTVLKTIADVIRKRIRETDYVARYGGDEFVLLLPDTEADSAKGLAEDLLEMVKDCGFTAGGKAVNVTLSIGIAQVKETDTVESVLENADRALYQVKESGRNGVHVDA